MAFDAFDWATLFLFLGLSYGAGLASAGPTMRAVQSTWYRRLRKAPWQPPEWAFQIWNLLYGLIALAGWLALRKNKADQWYYHASLVAWGLQLVLNAAWSPVFFVFRRIGLALAILVLTLLLAALTDGLFWIYAPIAASLLIPYVLWLVLAFTLNLYIAIENGPLANTDGLADE